MQSAEDSHDIEKPIISTDNAQKSKEVPPRIEHLALILVLIATIIWGSQYILLKQGSEQIPVFLFQGVRHLIAFLGFAPLWGRLKKTNKQALVAAAVSSVVFYFLLMFLTYGLQRTTSNKGAFLVSLYVVFTPFFGYWLLKSKIERKQMIAVSVAVIGMAIMVFGNQGSSDAESTFNVGDILCFIAALFNAIQIVLMEKYVKSVDIVLFVMLQMLFIGLSMTCTSFLIGETVGFEWSAVSGRIWAIWIYIALAATTITLIIQAFAQQYIESTRAALLYSLEPVFAIFFGVFIGGEPLYIAFIIGAILIMVGILISSLKFEKHTHSK